MRLPMPAKTKDTANRIAVISLCLVAIISLGGFGLDIKTTQSELQEKGRHTEHTLDAIQSDMTNGFNRIDKKMDTIRQTILDLHLKKDQ